MTRSAKRINEAHRSPKAKESCNLADKDNQALNKIDADIVVGRAYLPTIQRSASRLLPTKSPKEEWPASSAPRRIPCKKRMASSSNPGFCWLTLGCHFSCHLVYT